MGDRYPLKFNSLLPAPQSYARVGGYRLKRYGRTSFQLTRCQFGRDEMRTIAFDRSNSWNHPAHNRTAIVAPRSDQEMDAIAELEFSETLRSSSFPAGWFVLPSAIAGCLLLLPLLH
jgi:hypothetical protein